MKRLINSEILEKSMKESFGADCWLIGHRCYRCFHKWMPRKENYIPDVCPKCKSPYWKTPRIEDIKRGRKK